MNEKEVNGEEEVKEEGELLIESIQVPDGAVSRLEFQEFICMNDQKKERRKKGR